MAPQSDSAGALPDPDAKPPLLPHQTPDYLAANKGPTIMAITITVTAVSTIFVMARIFTRQKIMGRMHLDDWLVAPSIVRRNHLSEANVMLTT